MVDVSADFIKEEAKQARITHWYTSLQHLVKFPSTKQDYYKQNEIIFSRDYDVTIGALLTKASIPRKTSLKLKKRTIIGLKLAF